MDKLFQLESELDFRKDLEAVFNNLCESNNEITAIIDETKDILFKNNLITEKIEQLLVSKGFKEDRIEFFKMLMEQRKNELCFMALVNHNCSYGDTVTNFDWILKLVYGTSELHKLKYPILQLAFSIHNKRESNQKVFDIDKRSLTRLIDALEEVDRM